eukprot:CAMPEP_0174274258 /NCGR_PEP_ID=MMETSP0439-20130205/57352_1 /TAXON_ID=0 /ORGANISM="Stereomyxa ramosa, Strain Chinc5" /LENGTH=179 /DNA_ID=CAMNT_0015365907 /DNA_START=239 /DNA_END=778 /DNA_ORIENTATION=+
MKTTGTGTTGQEHRSSRLNDEMSQALNEQVAKEFAASNFYLRASFWFAAKNFSGIASFCRASSEEERGHALKICDHLIARGDTPELLPVVPPPSKKWDEAIHVWRDILELERANTESINVLADKALSLHDHATYSFLQWFVDEQVASEAETVEIVEKVKAYCKLKGLLYHLDKELGHKK